MTETFQNQLPSRNAAIAVVVFGLIISAVAPFVRIFAPAYLGLVFLSYGLGLLIALKSQRPRPARWVALAVFLGVLVTFAAVATEAALTTPHPLDILVGVLAIVIGLVLALVHLLARGQ